MQGLTFGSVCSGIEAASVAWCGQGARSVWFSEIDKFPCAVLQHHYPHVPNLGDMHALPDLVRAGFIEAPDILVGGTPCQSFSIAGLRKGMECPRGQLTLKYVELLNAIDEQRVGNECVAIWENVPGVLSDKSNAFGCFLAALAGHDEPIIPAGGKWTNAGCITGPQRSIAWRVLDAQYFGLAQRRKRLFVVASARSGYRPEQVLFEWSGVRRDIAPGRNAGQDATAATQNGFTASSFGGYREGVGTIRASGGDLGGGSETLVTFNRQSNSAYGDEPVASTLTNRDYKMFTGLVVGALGTQCGFEKSAHQSINAGHLVVQGESDTYALSGNIIGREPKNGGNQIGHDSGQGVMYTLTTTDLHAVAYRFVNWIVRRLTPVECEKLQGFPPNYTRIKFGRKGDYPDAPRYAALGNSFAVPVVAWIGSRLRLEGGL